ncbi:MAG: putative DNA binding domain-containing protein, partial [Synergistaceae bacterium]|nr:putative DNA binding domain-containing protein [Synergistaceae bacterium]
VYRENNRLEAKRAAGRLPNSIWETYSAFANTNGGIILLGVEENKDKTLSIAGIDHPEKLISDFWNTINNSQKVSINLLNDKKVSIIEVDSNSIIVIEVPRAERTDKPIYIGENPFKGTFRRNGEGDYHCGEEEINAMYRDKAVKTQDMLILEKMEFNVFSYDTIRSYRNVMRLTRPEHVWTDLEDHDFLYRIGAVAYGEDKKLHPTAAGLLMFGYEYEIVKEYPYYFLDYQERFDASERWDDRFVSSSGEWSGNVYDFFRKAYNKLSQNIKVPFKVVDGLRVEDTPVHKAIREALANCLINADYYERRGLVVKFRPQEITLENPGRFRIDIATAIEGIVTDPRNALLMKFFNLIDVGERSGRGVYEIYRTWASMRWDTPTLDEALDFDRTILTLPLKKETTKRDDKKETIKRDDKNETTKTRQQKEVILSFLEKNSAITTVDAAALLHIGTTRAKTLLYQLIDAGKIAAQGDNKNRCYVLRNQ